MMFFQLLAACSLVLSSSASREEVEFVDGLKNKCVLETEELKRVYQIALKDQDIANQLREKTSSVSVFVKSLCITGWFNSENPSETANELYYYRAKISEETKKKYWVFVDAFYQTEYQHCVDEILSYRGIPKLFLEDEGVFPYNKDKFLGGRNLLNQLKNIFIKTAVKAYKNEIPLTFYEFKDEEFVKVNFPDEEITENTFVIENELDSKLNNDFPYMVIVDLDVRKISADNNLIKYVDSKLDKISRRTGTRFLAASKEFLNGNDLEASKDDSISILTYKVALGLPLLLLEEKQTEFFAKFKCQDYPRFIKIVYSGGEQLTQNLIASSKIKLLLNLVKAFLAERTASKNYWKDKKGYSESFADAEKKFMEECLKSVE